MEKTPDFHSFGTNLYRAKLEFSGGAATIRHRSGLIGLIFLGFLTGIPAVIIAKEKLTLSGPGLWAYLTGLLGIVIAALYSLYEQELRMDFDKGEYRLRQGFPGFRKEQSGPFSDITSVNLREIRQSGHASGMNQTNSKTYISWGIGIECRSGNPPFEIWQSAEKEKADYISNELALAFGCTVKKESAFDDVN